MQGIRVIRITDKEEMTIEYHPKFSVLCSVGQAPFYGTIDIVYKPDGFLLEFESFEEWLRSIAKNEFTVESLTILVFKTLISVLGDIQLSVTVNAKTTVHAPISANIKQGAF